MPDPEPVGDLVTAVSDALRGDRTGLSGVVAGARQRAEERALDALARRTRQGAVKPIPAAVARPIPQPRPGREIQITLRNGRRVRAKVTDVGRRSDLSAVARASAENHRRAFESLGRHRRAIESLARSHGALTDKV